MAGNECWPQLRLRLPNASSGELERLQGRHSLWPGDPSRGLMRWDMGWQECDLGWGGGMRMGGVGGAWLGGMRVEWGVVTHGEQRRTNAAQEWARLEIFLTTHVYRPRICRLDTAHYLEHCLPLFLGAQVTR